MTFQVRAFLTAYFPQLLAGRCSCKEEAEGIRIATEDLPPLLNATRTDHEHLECFAVTDTYADSCRVHISEGLVKWALAQGIEKRGDGPVFSRVTNSKEEPLGLTAVIPLSLMGECLLPAFPNNAGKPIINPRQFIEMFPAEHGDHARH